MTTLYHAGLWFEAVADQENTRSLQLRRETTTVEEGENHDLYVVYFYINLREEFFRVSGIYEAMLRQFALRQSAQLRSGENRAR